MDASARAAMAARSLARDPLQRHRLSRAAEKQDIAIRIGDLETAQAVMRLLQRLAECCFTLFLSSLIASRGIAEFACLIAMSAC
jgi:hypothetical protein